MCTIHRLDVTKEGDQAELQTLYRSLNPKVDLAIINVSYRMLTVQTRGESNSRPFLQCSFEDLKRDVEDNYLVTANLLRQFATQMARNSKGSIAVVGRDQDLVPGLPSGSLGTNFSSGSAIWALCESIRSELAPLPVSFYPAAEFRTGTGRALGFLQPAIAAEEQAGILVRGIVAGYHDG